MRLCFIDIQFSWLMSDWANERTDEEPSRAEHGMDLKGVIFAQNALFPPFSAFFHPSKIWLGKNSLSLRVAAALLFKETSLQLKFALFSPGDQQNRVKL